MILGPYLHERGGVRDFMYLLLNNLQKYNVSIKFYPVGKRDNLFYTILFPFYFLIDMVSYVLICFKFKPHIVHLNPSLRIKAIFRDCIYLFVAKLFNCKVLFFIHGWNKNFYVFINKHKILRSMCVELFNKADAVTVLAQEFAKNLIKMGVAKERLNVFFIPIEYNNYVPTNERKSNDRCNILFLANFFKDKGIYELVESIPFVINGITNENFKFILAGDGPEMSNVKKMIYAMHLKSYIELPGFVAGEQKYNIFKNSDIFVFPTSHGEGFPTVIAEAMAAGLPIIATPVGAIPEVVETGVNGIIISKPDPREIADAIICLIRNLRLRKQMGNMNQEKALNYDVSFFVKQLLNLYLHIGGKYCIPLRD